MAFKPSVKKTIVDIAQSRIYLRGTKKFGKTTLFRDVVLEKYGDPEAGLLLGIGYETGYNLIENLNSAQITSWDELMEFKEWILSDDESAKKVKMVAFDTIDELIPIVEQEVCRISEKRYKEKCRSINDALKGFGRGQDKVVELLKGFFFDIHSAGKGVFAIAHTQLRTIRDKGSETTEGYQMLTSNLTTKYEAVFGDIFDFIFTGTIDRGIKDGVATTDQRLLYFRGNTRVDAGGRFAEGAVPEYMIFEGNDTAKRFIEQVENGMRKSVSKFSENSSKSDKEYEKYKEEVIKEHKEKAEEKKEEIKNSDKYSDFVAENGVEFLKKYFDNASFAEKIREVIISSGVETVKELSEADLIQIVKYGHEELGFELKI